MTNRIRMTRSTAGLESRGEFRPLPSPEELAPLMLAAYRGTPDDEGETLEDTIDVLRDTFDGGYGPVMESASFVKLDDGETAAAIVVAHGQNGPFIPFVFTHPDHARRGLASSLIAKACEVLREQGHERIELYVNDVNEHAIRCYEKLGFVTGPHNTAG